MKITLFSVIFGIVITVVVSESGCRFPEDIQGEWVYNNATERFVFNFTEESWSVSNDELTTGTIEEHSCISGGLEIDNEFYIAESSGDEVNDGCIKIKMTDTVLTLWEDYELNVDKIISELGSDRQPTCDYDSAADLVFVVDSSGSICDGTPDLDNSCQNWLQMITFISSIIDSVEIGPNATLVGFVSFGSDAYNEFYLNDYMDRETIKKALRDITYRREETNIAAGIQKMHKEQFTKVRGDRSDKQNIAIIITDGQSTEDEEKTIQYARDARAAGITIFTVGVTSNINENELKEISSEPQQINTNYFLAANFTLLTSILETLVQETCVSAGSDRQPTCDYDSAADLVFVVDTSGSICDGTPDLGNSCQNWLQMVAFISAIIDSVEIGPNATLVGFVSFGSDAYNEFYLNDHMDGETIKKALRDITYRREKTNIAAGIQKMHKEQFTRARGDRSDKQNIAIIITDGQSTDDKEKTIQYARDARAAGITIFTVGVTSNINENELKEISSEPQQINTNYFLAANFSLLTSILETLVQETCVSAENTTSLNGGESKRCLIESLDVVLAIDTADILNETQWQDLASFADEVTKDISDITFPSVRFGTLLFHDSVYYSQYLDSLSSRDELISELKQQQYITGPRRTSSAFRAMHGEFFTHENGDRDYAPNLVIVLTHGPSNMEVNRTIYDAFKLRSQHVHVYTVAVTSAVNLYEVQYISSYPHQQDSTYWLLDSFSLLGDVKVPLVEQICSDFSFDPALHLDAEICSLAKYTGSPRTLTKYPINKPTACSFSNSSAYQMMIKMSDENFCRENLESRAVVYNDIVYLDSCDSGFILQHEVLWCVGDTNSASDDQVHFYTPDQHIGKYYCSEITRDGSKTKLSWRVNSKGSVGCSEFHSPPNHSEVEETTIFTMELKPEALIDPGEPILVTSINPVEGPVSGGTDVVILGRFGGLRGAVLLDNGNRRLVWPVSSWTSTRIIAMTSGSEGIQDVFKLAISIPGQPIFVSTIRFTYQPDPVVTEVFPRATVVSGGTNLTVVGRHFDPVNKALLYINMERRRPLEDTDMYEVLNKTTFVSAVSVRVNDTMIVFTTPPITLPPDYLSLSGRRKRQAPLNSDYLGFDADVQLDGVLVKETLLQEGEPIELSIYKPYFEKADGVIKFDSDQETFLQIKGGNLTEIIGRDAYQVRLGLERCVITDLLKNRLYCSPPRSQPQPNTSLSVQNSGLPQLMVAVGNDVFHVGYVDYVKKTQMIYFIFALVVLTVGVAMMLVIWGICEKFQHRARQEEQGKF